MLGCIELPLAVPAARRGPFGAVLTNAIDAPACVAIARCRPLH
jgi:aspartate racemase